MLWSSFFILVALYFTGCLYYLFSSRYQHRKVYKQLDALKKEVEADSSLGELQKMKAVLCVLQLKGEELKRFGKCLDNNHYIWRWMDNNIEQEFLDKINMEYVMSQVNSILPQKILYEMGRLLPINKTLN